MTASPHLPLQWLQGSQLQVQVDRWVGGTLTFFADRASVLRGQGDATGAERFQKASTHWMRHSHASHAIASGLPIEIAQQNLGHASLATATAYVTTEKRRRMKAVDAIWQK